MGRELLGYRGRGKSGNVFVYAGFFGVEFCWRRRPPLPNDRQTVEFETNRSQSNPIDTEGRTIEVSDVKIVAVFLKTSEYKSSFASERVREDLSDFNRAVLNEIDRRSIDAIVEPEDWKGMPTTIMFHAPGGDFVWLPIVRYAVVDGPKETRASRTVDRMLEAIHNVNRKIRS